MGKAIRKRQTRRPKSRFSEDEKAEILAALGQKRIDGQTIANASAELGVSQATAYRWLSKQEANRIKLIAIALQNNVSHAIALLCDPSQSSELTKVEMIATFVAWLRWSKAEEYQSWGIAGFLSAYLRQTTSAKCIGDLEEDALKVLGAHLDLSKLARLCDPDAVFELPLWAVYPIGDQPYDDRDVLADIVWSILSIGKSNVNSRLSGSLSKSYYLVQQGCFKYTWQVGRNTLENLWSENSPAAPFLYVERYHSPLNWSLDPNAADFANEIHELLDRPEEVRSYFARCRWAIDALGATLTPRALENVGFPAFPESLLPEPMRPPPLTATIKNAIEGYRKWRK